MQLPINSANIATFFVKVSFDIYNRRVIWDTSGTTYNGSGAALVKGISFGLVDQSGVQLETINFTSPQIAGPITSGNWIYTTQLGYVDFAFLFQTYQITAAIQDSNGNIYTTVPVFVTLCQPQNITDSGYVLGIFAVIPDCINSVLTVKEFTQLVYNNLQPYSVTKSGTLNYPTGTISPITFANTPFNNNVIYTGQYNIQCTTVATYALGNDVYVLVSYVTNNVFPVTCQNKISDLMCCITQVQQTAIKHCDDALGENARHQLYDILPYVVTGIGKEISGQDAWFEADYIRKYLNCNCGSASQQQSEFTPINPAVTSIVLNGVGGTSVPSPTITGNTKTYNIASIVYQVVKGNTGDLAFTITTNTSISNTVQYLITINYDTFAGSILDAIAADPALINQLNSLVNELGFSTQGLNGQCIINLSQANYSLSIGVNSATLITNIVIAGNTYNAPANLFGNNASAVASWLNSLSLGTFTVSVSSNILTILSIGNTNVIATMTFTSPNVTQSFQVVTATLNQVLQAIFNYVCGMTALQVALGGSVGLCSFNYAGQPVATNYTNNQSQAAFNAGVGVSICSIVARMNSLTGLTCAALQGIFNDNPGATFNIANDRLLSVIGGSCTTATAYQIAWAMVNAINAYSDIKVAFCAINCTTPGTCPNITGINFGIVGSNIGIYGASFSQTPLSNQTVTVSYRVSGTLPWTVATNSLNLNPNGTINGTSPYQITGLLTGTSYDVMIQNNCGGSPFQSSIATPSGTSISGSYRIDNVLYNLCGDAPTALYSAIPFATGTVMYTNSGLTTILTGYTFIANAAGVIYTINTSTGVVGSPTGSNCTAGTAGTYILGNNTSSICAGSPVTLYTNGSFATGLTLYVDSSLTEAVTGYSYVVQASTQTIYDLNSSTGVIGASTGLSCSSNTVIITTDLGGTQISNVSGISGFTPSPSFPLSTGGTVTGTHAAFTGPISVTFTGTPVIAGNVYLQKNGGTPVCLNVTTAGTYSFPSASYLATDVITLGGATGAC